jgi:CP family cyanate transporter-like MFS transporter
LRPQLVGIGPLLPEIEADLDASHLAAGSLMTIPVLCQGLCAPLVGSLARPFGRRRLVASCLAGLVGFGLIRALAPSTAWLVVLTLPVGLATGLALGALPALVKRWMAERPAFATGVYTAGLNLGSTVSAATAVPLAGGLGSWRGPLAAFAVVSVLLLVVWLRSTPEGEQEPERESLGWRPPLRTPVVWLVVAFFVTTAMVFHGLTTWMPDYYVERGWDEHDAGFLVALLSLAAVPTSLAVPWLADRLGSRRRYLTGFAGLHLVAALGLVLAPGPGALWAVGAGIAIGTLFPLTMTLPVDLGRSPSEVAALAGAVLGFGYSLSAVAPLILGGIRDASGSFVAGIWLLAGLALAALLLAMTLSPRRLRRVSA